MRNLTKHVLIAKDVNYGASVGSATADTASNPQDLREGACGIFVNGELVQSGASTLPEGMAELYVKHADGLIKAPIYPKGIQRIDVAAYTAPVLQKSFLGYDGSGGSLNIGSIAADDEFMFRITETTQGYEPLPRDNYSYVAKSGDTEYEILADFVSQIYEQVDAKEVVVDAAILTDGTPAAFAAGTQYTGSGTPTITAINGSKTVTVASTGITSWDLANGSLIVIDGDTYKQIGSSVAANVATITLDRNYQGADQSGGTISGTNGASLSSVTEYGIEVTATKAGQIFVLGHALNLEQATTTEPKDGGNAVAANRGVGTPELVAALENRGAAYRGYGNRVHYTRTDLGQRTVNPNLESNGTYDIFKIDYYNVYDSKAFAGQAADPVSVYLCVDGQTSAVTEDIAAVLNLLAPATVPDIADPNA